jgi:hypothetical protein
MRSRYGRADTLTSAAAAFWLAAAALIVEGSRPCAAQITNTIPFAGQASGGTLMLCDTLNRNSRCAILETAPGESAESVARRLAQLINETTLWGDIIRIS